MQDTLTKNGHNIVGYELVPDDPVQIEDVIRKQIANSEVQVVLTTGGTGITSRDSTFEIVNKLLAKKLDGFGELFRVLSFQEIGAAAMLSRATAGTTNHTAIFVLPGSKPAVQLALTKLIVPELGHVVQQMNQ
jgi:molybdenum cofactor biosynthesis protein B